MSIKIEQRLDNFFFAEDSPKIYTTGAYLVPMKIKKENKERFVWIVAEFDDDSYCEGEICSPVVYADSLESLIVEKNEEADSEI
ncbi:MAG: hypothetical protein M3384_02170 [Acidobacteriota bacterium]|nr:hypothetical protein [Acidobacteriota bacterium]